MSPEIKANPQQRFGTERRGWIRAIDAILVLLMPLGLAGALFLNPVETNIPLLRNAFFGGLLCAPVVAWSLFRESGLNRIERIAILAVVLVMTLALMITALEAAGSS